MLISASADINPENPHRSSEGDPLLEKAEEWKRFDLHVPLRIIFIKNEREFDPPQLPLFGPNMSVHYTGAGTQNKNSLGSVKASD